MFIPARHSVRMLPCCRFGPNTYVPFAYHIADVNVRLELPHVINFALHLSITIPLSDLLKTYYIHRPLLPSPWSFLWYVCMYAVSAEVPGCHPLLHTFVCIGHPAHRYRLASGRTSLFVLLTSATELVLLHFTFLRDEKDRQNKEQLVVYFEWTGLR